MMSLRKRKQAGDSNQPLTETLLEEDTPNTSDNREIICYSGPFDVEKFLLYVYQSWSRFVAALSAYLKGVVSGKSDVQLSVAQIERLQNLWVKIAVPFDGSSVQHQDALKQLWSYAFPGLECTALKTAQWKEMGWQGDDPGTDFRGAGFYGLENLLYLAEFHQDSFLCLMHKTNGQRSDWEYPFAVAGLNITFMLVDLLDLQDRSRTPRSTAGRTFLKLLGQNARAFEEIYCMAFLILDRVWLQKRASYMDFSVVMRDTKALLEKALTSKPFDFCQLQAWRAAQLSLDVLGPSCLKGMANLLSYCATVLLCYWWGLNAPKLVYRWLSV